MRQTPHGFSFKLTVSASDTGTVGRRSFTIRIRGMADANEIVHVDLSGSYNVVPDIYVQPACIVAVLDLGTSATHSLSIRSRRNQEFLVRSIEASDQPGVALVIVDQHQARGEASYLVDVQPQSVGDHRAEVRVEVVSQSGDSGIVTFEVPVVVRGLVKEERDAMR